MSELFHTSTSFIQSINRHIQSDKDNPIKEALWKMPKAGAFYTHHRRLEELYTFDSPYHAEIVMSDGEQVIRFDRDITNGGKYELGERYSMVEHLCHVATNRALNADQVRWLFTISQEYGVEEDVLDGLAWQRCPDADWFDDDTFIHDNPETIGLIENPAGDFVIARSGLDAGAHYDAVKIEMEYMD